VGEWRLFDEGTVPAYTTPAFFGGHPWIDPVWQRGHSARIALARQVIGDAVAGFGIESVVDLGCGDGSLLATLRDLPVRAWGYDLGRGNVTVATQSGLDVRCADFLLDDLEYGDLIVATEVVEHLVDPRGFLRGLPGRHLMVSSPFDENDVAHYEHHAWAWDEDGYRDVVGACGWTVVEQRTCTAGFQAIHAVRGGA
jgi:2-polyprenyl-3-methyl-5-hydroxy-6-metoxy-1,4-benzoquinol methylase